MIDPDTPWRVYAECVNTDPELFFHESRSKQESMKHLHAAREVCGRCPAATQCLEDALANDERYGVFAGTTPEQRAEMRDTRDYQVTADRELVAAHEWHIRHVGNGVGLALRFGVTPEALALRVHKARRRLSGGAA